MKGSPRASQSKGADGVMSEWRSSGSRPMSLQHWEDRRALYSQAVMSLPMVPIAHSRRRRTLFASRRFQLALHLRQGRRFDQQALPFVTTTGPAEAHDNGPFCAFRLHPPREQRIARRQELKIAETNA